MPKTHVNALREILQEIGLCGLWRAKFFEHAAFYGGTALRVLYGLDRFSEDMDFSLLVPSSDFDLATYCGAVEEELSSWGFPATVEVKNKTADSAIESAFLKANTRLLLLTIDAARMASTIHGRRELKIKIEVDTDPASAFLHRNQVPSAADTILCQGICAPVALRREDARRSLPRLGDKGQGERLV